MSFGFQCQVLPKKHFEMIFSWVRGAVGGKKKVFCKCSLAGSVRIKHLPISTTWEECIAPAKKIFLLVFAFDLKWMSYQNKEYIFFVPECKKYFTERCKSDLKHKVNAKLLLVKLQEKCYAIPWTVRERACELINKSKMTESRAGLC